MAKKKNTKLKTRKQLKTADILNISAVDFSKLTKPQLRSAVQTLSATANKRLKALAQKGMTTPSAQQAEKGGGKFSTRGKNLNQLRSEFFRAKNFLESKTSTLRGYKNFVKENIEKLKEKGVNVTPEQFNKFWQTYNRLKEVNPYIEQASFKYHILQKISDEMIDEDIDIDKIIADMSKEIDMLYEEQELMDYENRGVSDFFRIE